jgi:hypothetical protein
MNCKNCGLSLSGKFCSHCGQNSKVGKIDFTSFINDFSESILQIDKGFFYTITELFLRPGRMLDDFLNGKRKNHFKPIAYVLTLSSVYFLITQVNNQSTWIDDMVSGYLNGSTGKNTIAELPLFVTWFLKNYAYSMLILLPVFSLASFLSFFKFDKSYIEHIVINSYITGQQTIIYSFFAIAANLVESSIIEAVPFLLAISYTILVFWQLFSKGNRLINILRTIMTYILYLIFSIMVIMILIGINIF